jgi:hypothetical protein
MHEITHLLLLLLLLLSLLHGATSALQLWGLLGHHLRIHVSPFTMWRCIVHQLVKSMGLQLLRAGSNIACNGHKQRACTRAAGAAISLLA